MAPMAPQFSTHFPQIKTKVIPVLVRPDGTHLVTCKAVIPWMHCCARDRCRREMIDV